MTTLDAADRRQLDELGYLVLPDFVPPPMLEEMRERVEALWATEGDDAGSEFRLEPGTRRLANLVDKGDVFARMIVMPAIGSVKRRHAGLVGSHRCPRSTDRCCRDNDPVSTMDEHRNFRVRQHLLGDASQK